ncbi:MAG: hypothetical protein H6667_25235 [Ardenticatenaceae bacterium]|nr:hypothetical protein [Ardenticatenaceae bacterium]
MKIVYSDVKVIRGGFVVEAAKIVGILAGIGATPLLQDQLGWFWAVGLAAGVLPVAAGIYYLVQQRQRGRIVKGKAPAGFRDRMARWGQRIWSGLKIAVQFWRWQERWQAGKEERRQRPLPLLPILTILIGFFIFIPAGIAFFIQRSALHQNVGLAASYFNAPAILLWITGEGFYVYPHFIIRPKHWPQISGLLKSGLQIISALLLWVFLGVSISLENANWMLWASLITAVAGFVLGIVAIQSAKNEPVPVESGQTVPQTT